MTKVCPLLISLLVLSVCSCNTKNTKSGLITEGIITYEITYPHIDKDDMFLLGMMPKELIMKFKGNNTIGELKTGAGVFTTRLVSNENKRNLFHFLKLVNKKYGLILDSAEIYSTYAKKPDDMKMVPSAETKVIAGFNCKKMDILFNDTSKNFAIYYTDSIGIKEPNWCTPYYDIKGVMMEYNISQFNIDMHLTAKSITPVEISDEEFAVPTDYETITQKEMEEKFTDF